MMHDDTFIELYDHYVHSQEPRRVFLKKLAAAAGGVVAAAAILPWLEGTGAEAAMIPADDGRIDTGMESFTEGTAGGAMKAYVARPKGSGKFPAVVVIHENRGLTDHIEDVARRLAVEGYLAVAPDMVSPKGGTPKDRDKARDVLYGIDKKVIEQNLVATANFARGHAHSTGKVGVVGFCWGGGGALTLAVADPKLDVAVSYYGNAPKSGIENINAAVLMNYAQEDNDPKRTKSVKPFKKKLDELGKPNELYFYPGTKHAFNNDARPARYNKEQAALAWKRTLALFEKRLKS